MGARCLILLENFVSLTVALNSNSFSPGSFPENSSNQVKNFACSY
jgi:hypothetical protein